jgi:hypothetical protein
VFHVTLPLILTALTLIPSTLKMEADGFFRINILPANKVTLREIRIFSKHLAVFSIFYVPVKIV